MNILYKNFLYDPPMSPTVILLTASLTKDHRYKAEKVRQNVFSCKKIVKKIMCEYEKSHMLTSLLAVNVMTVAVFAHLILDMLNLFNDLQAHYSN